jgi:hypothetical protein
MPLQAYRNALTLQSIGATETDKGSQCSPASEGTQGQASRQSGSHDSQCSS